MRQHIFGKFRQYRIAVIEVVSVRKHPAAFLAYINSAHPISAFAGRVGENDIRFAVLCFKVIFFKRNSVVCLNLTAAVA
jgi:hypothetical protein